MMSKMLGCGCGGLIVILGLFVLALVPSIDRNRGQVFQQMTASIEAQLKALDEKAHNANHVNQDPVIIQDHTVQRQQEANQYYATLFGIAVLGLSVVALVTAGFVRWVLLWHLRPIMAAYNKAATAQETNVPPTPPRYGGGPTWTKPNRPDCKQRPERYKVDIK